MMLLRIATVVVMLLAYPVQASGVVADLWDRPRSAQTVMAQPAVREAVMALQARSDARLLIVHGPRQDALLHAEELRAWLVALAIEGSRVRLRADATAATIRLEITD